MTDTPEPNPEFEPEPAYDQNGLPTPSEIMRRQSLSPVARRALEEADQRRLTKTDPALPPEEGGPKGPEPTRFGDWEKRGIVSDF